MTLYADNPDARSRTPPRAACCSCAGTAWPGGATGGGKSGWLNVLMGNLVACPDVVIWGIDLKKGMDLGPWAPCIGRLATTPEEARALLADAVAILEARAALLAARGQRVWEPSPDMPALIILIDEYAELVDDAPGAVRHADSVARRGRAVAVNLIAATQRPTQKAMGLAQLNKLFTAWYETVYHTRPHRRLSGWWVCRVGWCACGPSAAGPRTRDPPTTTTSAPPHIRHPPANGQDCI